MKKIGILIFIIAIIFGVALSNLFSFGRSSGKIFNFSFGNSVRGSGSMRSEVREVSEFTGLDVSGVFTVDAISGKDFALEIEADDNLLQYITTEVRGGVLRIGTTERIKSRSDLRVRVTAPDIDSLEASGAAKVNLSGVSNSSLTIDTSGASKINVEGETSRLKIDVSGASHIEAGSLKAEDADIDASGASSVDVFVSGKLVSHASGASRIAYSGNPKSVDKNASGAGKIHSN